MKKLYMLLLGVIACVGSLQVPAATTAFTLSATKNDSKAILINELGTITNTDTTVRIEVESEPGSLKTYTVVVKEANNLRQPIVPPGFGTLEEYLGAAEDGDTLILENGEDYTILGSVEISKDITIMARTIPQLPELADLPHIDNMFANENLIQMEDGGRLTLVGIDLDGGGVATRCISLCTHKGTIKGVYIDRCRLHDVLGDVIGGSKNDSTIVKEFVAKNSFIYNSGSHGIYLKAIFAEAGVPNQPYVHSNLTYWNLGQQLVWIQVFPEDTEQKFIFDHITGWNLITNLADPKELIGNSPGGGKYNITLRNTIFAE